MRSFIVAALLLTSASAQAQSGEWPIGIPRNTDYQVARQYLLSRGYVPERRLNAEACLPGDPRCEGRPEMQTCAPTGLAWCIFTWRSPRGASIEVTTVGEDPGVYSVRCTSGCI